MKKEKRLIIFISLVGVMILTLTLNFIMNYQFIQKQLKTNLILEIENEKEVFSIKLENYEQSDSNFNYQDLFQEDFRSNPITVLIYDSFGKNIAGNIARRVNEIDNITKMMLNGDSDTVYKDGIFYSFTNVDTKYGSVYLMLEMSDQKYIEGVRNYYFRTLVTLAFVSVSILLLGYHLIDVIGIKKE